MLSLVIQDGLNNWPPPYRPWHQITNSPSLLVSREEFDALKAQVEALLAVAQKAKEWDAKTGQPDCEDAQKLAMLRKLCEAVGINLDDHLKPAVK